MSTVTFPFNQTGITSIGATDSGTAWGGGGTGGNRISQYTPQQFDFLVTGATAVGFGGYYCGSASQLQFTLMDTSGNVLNSTTGATTSPAVTATSTFQNASVNLFPTYTMTSTTTYWVRILNLMGGGGLLQTNNLFNLTGPATPTVLTTGPYGVASVYTTTSTYGGTGLHGIVGLEGGMIDTYALSYNCWKGANPGSVANYAMVRFKMTADSLWVQMYPGTSSTVHLNRVPTNGSSGVSTQSFDITSSASNGWALVSNTLDNTTEYIYELSFSGGAGTIMYGMMTHGGTGINTSTTASSLQRQLLLAVIGDSRAADINGTGNPPHAEVGSKALLGQNTNKQVLNAGVPGQQLSAMAARASDVTWFGVPQYIMIDGGINDIKSGSPPTPSQLNTYMANIINAIRATSGFSTVPILYMLIKPADSSWVSGGHTYIDTYNTVLAGLAASYAAGTAPSQVGGADPNVHCIDTRTWGLADQSTGTTWENGGTFNEALFYDGLHLNSSASSPSGLGMSTEYGFLSALFAPVAGIFRSARPASHTRKGVRQLTT